MSKIIIQNVRVLDGTGEVPFAGQVSIEGNRIAEVTRGNAAPPPDEAQVVDGQGATLMPGLVNAHAHPSFANLPELEALGEIPPEEHTLLTMRHAKLLLEQGFTSVFSAAAAKPRLDIVVRNAIEAGEIPGPRYKACTPELTVSAGLGDMRLSHLHRETFAVVCDGADQFRRVAREYIREGVDTFKLNISGDEFIPHAPAAATMMAEDEIAAVCEVAAVVGKGVAAHARSAESVKLCIKHRIPYIFHATLVDEEARDMLEENKDWVYVAPTLGITYTTIYEAEAWGITTQAAVEQGFMAELESAVENMKDLHKRGVRVLPGGDYGFPWNPVGRDARDLEHFVTLLGFTPMEAIVATTSLAGTMMEKDGSLGSIKPGALADLLLVNGDPIQDITLLQNADNITGIMKDGEFYKHPAGTAGKERAAA